MAKIYWRTIKRGTRTFNDVPANLQSEVKALAKQEVVNGDLTKEEYKHYIGEKFVA
jgi:hypothetical protein